MEQIGEYPKASIYKQKIYGVLCPVCTVKGLVMYLYCTFVAGVIQS